MESIFSSSAAAKFGRESKPVEFKKKRAEVTPRLDEEEQAREDARAARNLAKKAKRTVKPRKEDAGKKDAPAPPAAPASGTKSKPEKERKPKKIVKSEDDGESSVLAQEQEQEQEGDVNSKDARTAFFGNVPITETEKSLTAFCSEFGEVESIRLRSLPVAGTAVDDNGNQDLVRKVCAIKKKFGGQKGSFNAYVVFKTAEAVTKAMKANNRIMGATAAATTGNGNGNGKKQQQESKKGRHLRVDRVNPTLFDPAVTVYVGGVPHYCDEEELREHFAAVLPKGQRDLHSIRIVRIILFHRSSFMSVSLSLSHLSIAACLHSLTPRCTSLTIISSPSLNQSPSIDTISTYLLLPCRCVTLRR
jgi:nucleolar protein 12